jgi:hypothetical protein
MVPLHKTRRFPVFIPTPGERTHTHPSLRWIKEKERQKAKQQIPTRDPQRHTPRKWSQREPDEEKD